MHRAGSSVVCWVSYKAVRCRAKIFVLLEGPPKVHGMCRYAEKQVGYMACAILLNEVCSVIFLQPICSVTPFLPSDL